MRISVELPDRLLRAARRLALNEGVTFRAVVEEGLRAVLTSRQRHRGFRLRDASFGGGGLRDDARLDDVHRGSAVGRRLTPLLNRSTKGKHIEVLRDDRGDRRTR